MASWCHNALMALMPQRVLKSPMVLRDQDKGALTRAAVLAALGNEFGEQWTVGDLLTPERLPFETKWRDRASCERADMVRDGQLQDRAYGMWALIEAGCPAAAEPRQATDRGRTR